MHVHKYKKRYYHEVIMNFSITSTLRALKKELGTLDHHILYKMFSFYLLKNFKAHHITCTT